MFDTNATGQQIKRLTVVAEFPRECLTIDVAGSIRSKRVIEVLSTLGQRAQRTAVPAPEQRARVRQPRDPRVDRAKRHRHGLNRPRKPWQNGSSESSNGKLRDESAWSGSARAPRPRARKIRGQSPPRLLAESCPGTHAAGQTAQRSHFDRPIATIDMHLDTPAFGASADIQHSELQ